MLLTALAVFVVDVVVVAEIVVGTVVLEGFVVVEVAGVVAVVVGVVEERAVEAGGFDSC